MKNQSYRFVCLLLILLTSQLARGGRFLIDHLDFDSAWVYPVTVVSGDTIVANDSYAVPNGTAFEAIAMKDMEVISRGDDGKMVAVSPYVILFDSDTPSDIVAKYQNGNLQRYHSSFGHFVHSYTFLWIIFAIAAVSTILWTVGIRMCRTEGQARALLNSFPICLMAVAVMEIISLLYNDSLLWWIDQDRLGFIGTLWRMGLLIAVAAWQILSGLYFKRMIADDDGSTVAWKPVFLTVAICVPLTAIAGIILSVAGFAAYQDPILETIFLGCLAAGIVIAFIKNNKKYGPQTAILLTSVCFFYAIGCLLVCGLLIYVLVKFLIYAVIWLVVNYGLLLLLLSGGSTSERSSDRDPSYLEWQSNQKAWDNYHKGIGPRPNIDIRHRRPAFFS